MTSSKGNTKIIKDKIKVINNDYFNPKNTVNKESKNFKYQIKNNN